MGSLDAPDAEYTGLAVYSGGKLLSMSAEMSRDNFSYSHFMEMRVINPEHRTLADLHFSKWVYNPVRSC